MSGGFHPQRTVGASKHYLVSIGTMDTILCHPREIFRLAVMASRRPSLSHTIIPAVIRRHSRRTSKSLATSFEWGKFSISKFSITSTARFCSSCHPSDAPAFVPLHALGSFQSRKAAKIRFVFPKRRSFRRREHCPGGGGGRRGHDLDKRSGAIQCQRQTRSRHGIERVLLAI